MSKCETAKSQIPADIEELWGEPALLSFEGPEIYRKLLPKIVADVAERRHRVDLAQRYCRSLIGNPAVAPIQGSTHRTPPR
jgi:hypothetical protein